MGNVRFLVVALLVISLTTGGWAQSARTWLYVEVLREGVPASQTRIRFFTQNIERVQCSLYQISSAQFLKYATTPRFYPGHLFSHETARMRGALPEPEGKLVLQWESRLKAYRETAEEGKYYSRTVFLPKVDSGVYYLRVSAGNQWQGHFVTVSRMGCVAKIGADGVLLYAYDYQEGKPLPNVQLTLINNKHKPFKEVRTNGDGIARLPADDAKNAYLLLAQRGNDVLFHYLTAGGVRRPSRWKFYLYTDRPIYRPGQVVHYKVVVRRVAQQEYRNAPNEKVNLRIEDPRGRTIFRTTAHTNALGTCSGTYRLNAEATVGEYTLFVERDGEERYAVFEVAAYRKPDFAVQVTPEQPRYVGAGKGVFLVKATYYFGAPVAQAKVRYILRAQPYFPWRPEQNDEETTPLYPNLYPPDIYGYSPVVSEGEATTDAQGMARVEFDMKPSVRSDTLYIAQVTVQDAGGRSIQAQGTLLCTRAEFFLRAQIELYFVTRNQRFSLHVQAQSYEGAPVATPFSVELIHTVWDKDSKSPREETVHTWSGETAGDGKASLELSWGKEGFYRLRVTATDGRGNSTETDTFLHIWGREYRYLTMGVQPTSLQIVTDRSTYQPGDTAQIMILASRTPTIVWLTVETDRVLWSKQVKIQDAGGAVVQIPVRAEYRPGVYLCAVALMGYYAPTAVRYLRVPYSHKRIQVHLETDHTRYLPGDRVRYRIRTTDLSGNPLSAELSLGVVDAAIYGLRPDTTPDPFRVFWGKRPHGVYTTQFLPEAVPGGAFQKVASARWKLAEQVQIRRRFEDTAYWNAHITTDANGEAQVEFELPDNLTRWVATARAFTAETDVGEGKQDFVVNKPLMVRLYTPRFAVEGDRIRFQVMLSNHTGNAQKIRLSLFARPVGSLAGEVGEERVVELRDGEQKRLDWQPFPAIPLAQRLRLMAVAVAEGVQDRRMGTDSVEQSLPVLPRATLRRDVWGSSWTGQATAQVRLPEGALPQFGEMVLRLYNSPVARALPALADLVFYPYGCTEQTASTLLGIAFARQIARHARIDLAQAPWLKRAQERLNAGLTRLYDLQMSEGGWAWWEEEEYPLPKLTAYALIALAQLKEAGVEVDAEVTKRGIAAAREMLAQGQVYQDVYNLDQGAYTTNKRGMRSGERAWLVYALALHGNLLAEEVEKLWRQRGRLSNQTTALLGLALNTLPEGRNKERLNAIMQELVRRVQRGEHGTYWSAGGDDWYTSTAECTAFVLRLLLKHQPRHPLIASTLQWLLWERERGWFSTKAQAQLLGAIAEYVRHYSVGRGGQTVQVQIGDRPPVNLQVPSLESEEPFVEYRLPLLHLQGEEWQVKLTAQQAGDVELAYTIELRSYLPLQPMGVTASTSSADLRITRRYFVLKRQPPHSSSGWRWEPLNRSVHVGETVMVEVEVQTKGMREYLIIEDPYPAGFEFTTLPPYNPNSPYLEDWYFAYNDRCEPQDQHVAIFAAWIYNRYRYRYYLRAETPGERLALPTRVEMMYRPEVRAVGRAQPITVIDEE